MSDQSQGSATSTHRFVIIAVAVVVLIVAGLAVFALSGSSQGATSAPARGPNGFPGGSSQQIRVFQSCLKKQGVTIPSDGFGAGRPPSGGFGGGTPPTQRFTGGPNSANGKALSACRALIPSGGQG